MFFHVTSCGGMEGVVQLPTIRNFEEFYMSIVIDLPLQRQRRFVDGQQFKVQHLNCSFWQPRLRG